MPSFFQTQATGVMAYGSGQARGQRRRKHDDAYYQGRRQRARGMQFRGATALEGGGNRNMFHTMWNNAANPNALHWDWNSFGTPYLPIYNPRDEVRAWSEYKNPYPWPWTEGKVPPAWVHGVDIGGQSFNDLKAEVPPADPGRDYSQAHISGWRRMETDALILRGRAWLDVEAGPELKGVDVTPLWAFMGMADSRTYGTGWSCFYYTLSAMYTHGFGLGSDIMAALMQICGDIMDITAATGKDISMLPCRVLFEGTTTPDSVTTREFMWSSSATNTLANISNDPTQVLMDILHWFISSTEFIFHRVYIHVLTNLNMVGGSLERMPEKMKKARDGPFYKGIKGYNLVNDSEDCSCGLDALVWALANAIRRIQKRCKAAKDIPSICAEFSNYRKRVVKEAKKGSKNRSQLVHAKVKGELASYIGWTCGTPLSHEDLTKALNEYCRVNSLDIGLIIFDAIMPLVKFSASYDATVYVPGEILCLVHWDYPHIGESAVDGHYDCINTTNLSTWLQSRSGRKRKDLRFSFRRFAFISSNEADDKGQLCPKCKHWQKDATNSEWLTLHCGDQKSNTIECKCCKVRFKTSECYAKHLVTAHGNSNTACASASACVICGSVHANTYDCTRFYCQTCRETFPIEERKTHVCFLTYISEQKCKRLEKVIYSDMEGSRTGKLGSHVAVCISSYWSTICAEHKKLRDKSKCKACKWHHDTWNWFCDECDTEIDSFNACVECSRKHSTYFEGEDCLDKYMEWLMGEHLGATVVFHNGGKYDLQILVTELLSQGKYMITHDAMRSSQIIFFIAKDINCITTNSKKDQIRFIDSLNFIQASLREFPKMFGLKDTDKGRFPYELMNQPDWKEWKGSVPSPLLFGVTEMELKQMDFLAEKRKKDVKEIMEYIAICEEEFKNGKRWDVLENLKHYTLLDTKVLHEGCESFRRNFWMLVGTDPFQWVTLASAVAASYRQPQFMKAKSIQICCMKDRLWQQPGMRGGRCEPFKLYWRKTSEKKHAKLFDINSEYPFVQAFGYYPDGAMTADIKFDVFKPYAAVAKLFYRKTKVRLDTVLHDPTGKSGCGIIELEYQTAKDTFIPIVVSKVKSESGYTKNYFKNGSGSCTMFLTILAEAVTRKQVIILKIKRIQFWATTTNRLFRAYMCKLYAAKVEASGWEKILNKKMDDITEEEKAEFLAESKRRGITIDSKNIRDSPGMRSTAKVMNNCGWGYLAQKPNTTENHFYDNDKEDHLDAMKEMLVTIDSDVNPRRMVGEPSRVGNYTRIRTTKAPEDITDKEMNKKIAYQVGGQVPAYGLQLLTGAGLLALDSSQPMYCDTDSVVYEYDDDMVAAGTHKLLPTGPYLGDWVDEYPDYEIEEFITLGSKTYFMRMRHKVTGAMISKGRFKGIPMNSSSFSLLNKHGELAHLGAEEMKRILFHSIGQAEDNDEVTAEEGEVDALSYEFKFTNFFKRNSDFKITAREEKKTVRNTFDKRKIIVPKLYLGWEKEIVKIETEPLDDLTSTLTEEEIGEWWNKEKKKIY
jgi:hypothetical protein